MYANLAGSESLSNDFENEVGPEHVQTDEEGNHPVEYVVGRKHWNNFGCFNH